MLLNLSNHPSTLWPDSQLRAAEEQYGGVEDMSFPQVPPEAGADAVRELAVEYAGRIAARNAEAEGGLTVHVMGEMTFTFLLVDLLRARAIPCVASTTAREVIEEGGGKKTAVFRFVRFRSYF
jgi:hypothetical protein